MSEPVPSDAAASEIDTIRQRLADLQAQNQVLRYSQAASEAASERFETLFASVPLALMVLDEHDLVVQCNATALRWFQPSEHDRPLTFLEAAAFQWINPKAWAMAVSFGAMSATPDFVEGVDAFLAKRAPRFGS